MNRIIEFCETISEAIAATFLGVGIGVVAALWVIAHGMNP
jgi:hypothetical protein